MRNKQQTNENEAKQHKITKKTTCCCLVNEGVVFNEIKGNKNESRNKSYANEVQ